MKIRIFLLVAILLAFSSIEFAQTVKITPKQVSYNRPKTIENEYKRSFKITYPKVSGASGKKIESVLNYEKIFDYKLKYQIRGEDTWLDEISYDVNYNKNGILDVLISMEGSGAYPSVTNRYFVVNTKSGSRVRPVDVFTNLAALASKAKAKQKAEVRKTKAELKADPEAADFDASEYFNNAKFMSKDLNEFSVSEKGVTFRYDYGFPHVALAYQPSGEYFFTWKELRPFIKKGSLFAQFAK